MAYIIISLIYTAGYLLSYNMLRIEHEAEGVIYTKGARLLSMALSLLSWLMFLIIVVGAWLSKIKALGYFDKPVKPESK